MDDNVGGLQAQVEARRRRQRQILYVVFSLTLPCWLRGLVGVLKSTSDTSERLTCLLSHQVACCVADCPGVFVRRWRATRVLEQWRRHRLCGKQCMLVFFPLAPTQPAAPPNSPHRALAHRHLLRTKSPLAYERLPRDYLSPTQTMSLIYGMVWPRLHTVCRLNLNQNPTKPSKRRAPHVAFCVHLQACGKSSQLAGHSPT